MTVSPRRVARRLAVVLCALALGAACAAPGGGGPASLRGQPAPDFSLRDSAGRPVSLRYFRGQRHVVLVLYIDHT